MKNKYKVSVNEGKCIGCGGCESVADSIFSLNDKGKSEVINQDGGTDEDKLLAAQACPTDAIEVTDVDTGEVQWPKDKILERGGEEE